MLKTKTKMIIIDDNGEQIKTITLKKGQTQIKTKIGNTNKRFKINKEKDKFLKIKNFMRTDKYYFFNENNPEALKLQNFETPIFNTEDFDSIIETKVLKDLNKPNESNLLNQLEFKHILIGLGVIAVIIYFATGGTLT